MYRRPPLDRREADEWAAKYNQYEDRHHLFPKSRWGSDRPENLRRISRKVHEQIHKLFGIETPREQLDTRLKINEGCLNPIIVEQLREIIDAMKFYKDEVCLYLPDEYV